MGILAGSALCRAVIFILLLLLCLFLLLCVFVVWHMAEFAQHSLFKFGTDGNSLRGNIFRMLLLLLCSCRSLLFHILPFLLKVSRVPMDVGDRYAAYILLLACLLTIRKDRITSFFYFLVREWICERRRRRKTRRSEKRARCFCASFSWHVQIGLQEADQMMLEKLRAKFILRVISWMLLLCRAEKPFYQLQMPIMRE